MHRYLLLDGLRGVAAIAVLIYHRRWFLPGGAATDLNHASLAVDFFFLLSGFVIALAYDDKLRGGLSLRRFIVIRAIRLYPLILLGSALALIPFVGGEQGESLWAVWLNVFALPVPPQSGAPCPFFLNGPAWSLFFELVVNVAFALTVRWLTMPVLIGIVAVSGALLIAVQVLVGPGMGFNFNTFWFGPLRCLFPFALGVLIQRLHVAGRLPRISVSPTLIAGGLAATLLAPLPTSLSAPYAIFCGLVVFPVILWVGAQQQLSGRQAAVAGLFGVISYPLYMLHAPIYALADPIWSALSLRYSLYIPVIAPAICLIAYAAHR